METGTVRFNVTKLNFGEGRDEREYVRLILKFYFLNLFIIISLVNVGKFSVRSEIENRYERTEPPNKKS